MGPLLNNPTRCSSTVKNATPETAIHTIGLDIAKNSFAVHGFDAEGHTGLTKDLKRGQVLMFFAKLPACRVGLEACASAHYWARNYGITVTSHFIS
jgi:hypothetical protein